MSAKIEPRKFIDYTTDSSRFDLQTYLKQAVPHAELLTNSVGRKFLTANNPLLFALVYYPGKLTLEGKGLTFADFHLEVSKWAAMEWTKTADISIDPAGPIDAYICPRGMGKSTWVIDILVMWAACHGHQEFVALFADTPTQAQQHLSNFRESAATNELLKADYPRICRDGTNIISKHLSEIKESDRQDFYRSTSGFAFSAKGIDTGVLGLKVGDNRPSLIIADDIIKGSGSLTEMNKRLDKFIKSIVPLRRAGGRIVITGTSFTPGDMIHQLKKAAELNAEPSKWITGLSVQPHYYSPFIKTNEGEVRSCWSDRWSLEYLLRAQENDPSFAAAFLNEPIPENGSFWHKRHFVYGSLDTPGNSRILSIDPALTAGSKSDFTAITIAKYSNAVDKFEVVYSGQFKLQGESLRAKVLNLVSLYDVSHIIIETNSVGTTWMAAGGILHDIPGVTIIPVHYGNGESKEARAEWALMDYQKERVLHTQSFYDLETQLMAFPQTAHDDLVDSLTSIIYTVRKSQKEKTNTTKPRVINYV
jgi:hypothetical protein